MKIEVKLKENSYQVFINELKELEFKGKVAIISNAKVAGLHMQSLLSKIKADELFIITIKDGEEYKSLATAEEILNQLFTSKLDRKSTLIALGGGVISDIVGFVASIYQRGIDFINIPTTLLACVDAAVGGKTGVNNSFGKNLIGTFKQPKAVYCESSFLKTLPQRELSAGMAEFIKMALSFDEKSLEFIENLDEKDFFESFDDEIYKQIIAKSVALKADVVSKDEKENNLRMLLNYGHTFAHIIENQTAYKGFLHGEAVAIGMNMANRLALNLGLLKEDEVKKVQRLLSKFKLPTSYKIEDVNEFYEAFFLDKKTHNEKINFILLSKLGEAFIKNDVPKDVLLRTLEEFK